MSGLKFAAGVLLGLSGLGAAVGRRRRRMEPIPGFRIADNLYWVGSKDLASYLISTPQGHILINSGLVESVPLIQKSIESLGFKMKDVKILLISHAHKDQAAGSADIKELTGAQYMVMDSDVPSVESGGATDFLYTKDFYYTAFYTNLQDSYPVAKVNRVLHDGDEVRLGDTVLVAHKTPGDTKGCTTWTMKVTDKGKAYHVVIAGGWDLNPELKLVDNPAYPQIAEDYEKSFAVFKSLPCDIFLSAYGNIFDMQAKVEKMKQGGANPFVDPAVYKAAVAQKEADFYTELKRQQN